MKLAPLSAKQQLSWQLAEARQNLWEGSVRSGKTHASLLAWSELVRTAPPGNLAMIGRTERTLKRNILDVLTEMWGGTRCRLVQGMGEFWMFGRRIYLVGANDEQARTKIQGMTLLGAYLDEATTVPESFFAMLLSRLSEPGARLFATMNPEGPAHWMLRQYLSKARVHLTGDGQLRTNPGGIDIARFSFRLADNKTLPAEYIGALTAEYTGLWRRRYIEGEWVAAEGAIYALEIEPGSRHVVVELPQLRRLRLAIDYGTANPFVALLMGVSAEPRLYVAREWRYDSKGRRTMTDEEYVRALAAWLAGGCGGFFTDEHGHGLPVELEKIVCDPSAASFRAAWQRHFKRWPEAADNAVLDGIRDEASLLGAGRLAFHESCREAIDEHASYVWDPKAQEKGDDAPVKLADHGPDACRYGVRSYRTVWKRWLTLPPTQEEAAA